MRRVELARQALRDLRKTTGGTDLDRVEAALAHGLTADPPPENLDVKALQGHSPWLRLRVWGLADRVPAAEPCGAQTTRRSRVGGSPRRPDREQT